MITDGDLFLYRREGWRDEKLTCQLDRSQTVDHHAVVADAGVVGTLADESHRLADVLFQVHSGAGVQIAQDAAIGGGNHIPRRARRSVRQPMHDAGTVEL